MNGEGEATSQVTSSFEAGAPSGTFAKPAEAEKADVSPSAEAPEIENKPSSSDEEQVVVPQTSEEAELSKMSPRERAGGALRGGVEDIIRKEYDNGFFSQPGREEAKKDAEAILKAAEQGDLDSNRLKLYFETLNVIGGETAEKVNKIAAEYLRIRIGDRFLTLDEWRAELDAAQKPAVDGSDPDPQKIQELESGIFGYNFLEDSAQAENATREKSPEDIVIDKELASLEKRVQEILKKGGQPTIEQQQGVIALRYAARMKGEAAPLLNSLALEHLRISGTFGLEDAMRSVNEKLPIAEDNVREFFKNQNLSESDAEIFINAVKTGKLPDIIKEGRFPQIEGLREVFFGKDVTEKELKELLEIEKKKGLKDTLLLAILLAAIGPAEFVQKTVPMEPSR